MVAVVSASSKPRARAARRSATAPGGARCRARSRDRRRRSDGDELQVLVARRRLADHHDPRSFREQDVPEAFGIGGDADHHGLRRVGQVGGSSAACEHEPRPPGLFPPAGVTGTGLRSELGGGIATTARGSTWSVNAPLDAR